jgi:uncharacterized membrane protein YhaH (DUF805 family)
METNQIQAEITKSVKTCFEKYVDFSGRAARPEFWWFALVSLVVFVLVQAVLGSILGTLVILGFMLPSVAVGSRRLHDIGKSGWFQLLWFVPVLGWAVMIYFLVQPSVAGSNEYGSEPSSAMPPVDIVPPGAA